MASSETLNFFMRLVKERHDTLIRGAAQMLSTMAGDDPKSKGVVAASTVQMAKDLRGVLSEKDVPPWLSDLINCLERYVSGAHKPGAFLESFVAAKRSLDTHHWAFDEDTEQAIDFDAIFQLYKRESRLPQLFDEIINLLQEVHDSGEIDSNALLNGLARVIATLKRCKDGSYFSLNSAWDFLVGFANNCLWAVLKETPVLGTVFGALEKSLNDAQAEMAKLNTGVREASKKSAEQAVKALVGKSDFGFGAYDQAGKLPPPKAHPLLIDTTA